jgi:hypothetical protein
MLNKISGNFFSHSKIIAKIIPFCNLIIKQEYLDFPWNYSELATTFMCLAFINQ